MIGSLGRFAKLPISDQTATIEALATVGAARLLMSALPQARLSQWLRTSLDNSRLESRPQSAPPSAIVERVRTAVTRVSRRIPGSTCLVQAIAGRWMFKYRGFDAKIRIGVDKVAEDFSAHAWLTIGDTIVLGGADAAARFVVLESK